MSKLFLLPLLWLLFGGCYSQQLQSVNHCKACENLVSFGKRLTNALSEPKIRNSLVQWCEESGNNANHGVCLYLANDIMLTVARINWDTFCGQIKACPLHHEQIPRRVVSKENITCDFCLNTMTHIKGIVASKQTEDEFKLLLSNICNYFGSFRNECITMLDQNLDDIFDYLRNVMDPNEVCKEMGFCVTLRKSNSAPEIEEVVNLYPVNSFDAPIQVDWRDAQFKAMAKPMLPSITFGPECFICRKVFKYVYNYINKSEEKTDEVIVEALDKVCAELFTSGKEKCDRIVNESIRDIVYYVKMATEPDIACTLLGYCLGRVQLKAVSPEWKSTVSPNCDLCKMIMKWVYTELKDNRTEEAIRNALDRVCDEVMPAAKVKQCKDLVNKYVEQIIDMIIVETDPDTACQMLGFCRSKLTTNCEMCKLALTWVYNELKDNRTEEAIRNALDQVCVKVMPASRVQQCKNFVDSYVEQIINLIVEETNPDEACQMLGLCPTKPAKPLKNGIDCLLCKKMMKWIYAELQDNKTMESIKSALDRVCQAILPESKVQSCIDFVNTYTQELIDVIIEYETPGKACVALKYCGQKRVSTKVIIPMVKLTKATKVGYPFQGAVCDICRQVFGWLNQRVSDPKVKEDVIKALDEVCQALPKDKQQECTSFVEKYANEIIEVISNETNPDVACAVMHLCKFNKNENRVVKEVENTPIKVGMPSFRSEFCYVCQLTSHFIQEELYNYKNEEAINQFIKKELCNKLVIAVEKETCNKYIDEYGAQIEQLVAQKIFDPTMVCEHILRICPKNTTKNPKLEFALVRPSKEKVCQVCMKAVDRLDEVTATIDWKPLNKNMSLIAMTACKVLPEEDIVECKKIIETYGLSFLELKNLKESRKVCQSVDICYMHGQVHLLGGKKCTFGPSYWCHTYAHADACKATDYCKQKYWIPMQ